MVFHREALVFKIFVTLVLYFSVKIFLRQLWLICWFCGIPKHLYASCGCSSSIFLYFLCWFSTSPFVMFIMAHLSITLVLINEPLSLLLHLLSSLCRVFILVYLKQTMFIGYIVSWLFYIYNLCYRQYYFSYEIYFVLLY